MPIVFLTHAFPPLKFPQSIQIARFVKYSAYDIRVICCDENTPKDHSLAEGMEGKPSESFTVRREAPKGNYLPRLMAHITVPDQYRAWSSEAASTALERGWVTSKDLLVTFGEPMSVHLAGLRIRRATGVPWIAHFSDPWADNPHRRFILARYLNRRLEAAVVGEADRVIFTSEETADLVLRKYSSSLSTKVRVLSHSFDPELYGSGNDRHQGTVIRYLGNFYGRRSPLPFIRGVYKLYRERPETLEGVSIEFIGTVRRIPKKPLNALPSQLLRFMPPVDYRKSIELMEGADLLLVIDAPFDQSVFFPSKLVDYIGARRPILAVTPEGTSAKVVRDFGGYVANPGDINDVAEKLAQAIDRIRASGCDVQTCQVQREEFSARAVVARMDCIINEVMQGAVYPR